MNDANGADLDPDDALKNELRLMGRMIRETRASELGWLRPPKSAWPDAPMQQLGLKDRLDQTEAGAAPIVKVIEARLSPEEISRSEAMLEQVMNLPRREARVIVIGWSTGISMRKLARFVKLSKRQSWRIFDRACARLTMQKY